MDYYKTLGVDKNASDKDIKRAYRKLAMKHHPDKGGDSKKFASITEAYDTLKDPQKRAAYDNPQPQYRKRSPFEDPNFNPFSDTMRQDPFSEMFSQQFAQRRTRNKDITISLAINFEDQFYGKTVNATYRLPSGKEETVELNIPPGAKSGDIVKFNGLGDNSFASQPRGSLNVQIKVRKDPHWTRDGDDIYTNVKIDVFDLILGTEVEIVFPTGKVISLKVPAGTRPGVKFSIHGEGAPNNRHRRKGSAYIQVDAIIPKITNTDLLNKISELKNEINQTS